MRIVIGVLLASVAVGAQPPSPAASARQGMQPASTMSELMVKIIYPASDAIFYITTRQPKTEAEWVDLQGQTLAVAESANLLMMPGRARDQERWMDDARLMLDAGRAAFRAAKAKDVAALEALNDQLYLSCTTCHQHYRTNYGARPRPIPPGVLNGSPEPPPAPPPPPSAPRTDAVPAAPRTDAVPAAPRTSPASDAPRTSPAKPKLEGRWKLRTAEDLRADGSVARLPWGPHPAGSIIVERGACYVQIMSTDTPSFAGAAPAAEQMKAALTSTYIAYSGPCTINDAESSVTLKVDAAWQPNYIGTEQKRFFTFDKDVLLFGPAPGSIRSGNEQLTRRLTLDRVP